MGEPRLPEPVLLIVAAFSRHASARAAAHGRLSRVFGPIHLRSAVFSFDQTRYYEPTMGSGLEKEFFAFRDLIAPERLAAIKRRTNDLEAELAGSGEWTDVRPLNLDPGCLSLGKFVLATTKDQSHRVYLGEGVHAEVTLRYRDGQFEPWPWTYADYRVAGVLEFLALARDYYRRRLRDVHGPSG